LEINEAIATETAHLLESVRFSEIVIKKDIHDRDRMIKAVNR